MNFQTKWHVSGVDFNSSMNAFIQSIKNATSSQNLKEHESFFNKTFKKHINDNMRRAGMEADNLADVFALQVGNQDVSFINTEPLITQRYEYGYYVGSKDTNEEYYEEYMLQTSPRYFLRPAIQATLDEIGNTILKDAKKEYNALKEYRDEVL